MIKAPRPNTSTAIHKPMMILESRPGSPGRKMRSMAKKVIASRTISITRKAATTSVAVRCRHASSFCTPAGLPGISDRPASADSAPLNLRFGAGRADDVELFLSLLDEFAGRMIANQSLVILCGRIRLFLQLVSRGVTEQHFIFPTVAWILVEDLSQTILRTLQAPVFVFVVT